MQIILCIGGGSICITRETKGIGRGQATAVIEVCAERDRYYEDTVTDSSSAGFPHSDVYGSVPACGSP